MRFAVLLLALTPLCFAAGELSNRRAPGFSLPDVDLRQHDLTDYAGKVVIVNFMQLNCPRCREFSKVLGALEADLGGRAKVLSVVNHRDIQAAVKGYLAEARLSNTILFDCGQMAASYLKLTPQNPTFNIPHFFVIDAQGWIREDYGYDPLLSGAFEREGLERILDNYLTAP